MHALVTLGHAVAGGDGAELHRRAAGSVDAVLDVLRHLVQVEVAGHQGVPGVGDADQGLSLSELTIGIAHGLEKRAGKGTVLFPQDRLAAKFHSVFLLIYCAVHRSRPARCKFKTPFYSALLTLIPIFIIICRFAFVNIAR